jgi:hypothetical protein
MSSGPASGGKKAMTIGQAKNKDMLICSGSDLLYQYLSILLLVLLLAIYYSSLQQGAIEDIKIYAHCYLSIYIYIYTRNRSMKEAAVRNQSEQ